MEDAHARDVEEVLSHFSVELSIGLSGHQVEAARARYGRNSLPPDQGTPLWKLILKQFDDLLVKILLAAAIIDFVIGISDGEGLLNSMLEPMVILLILVANATVGVVTERNAEKAIDELRAYEAENATVLRDGTLQLVPADDLVPGDVVEVTVGNKVPADIRVAQIFSSFMRADQSILTGESNSVEKTIEAFRGGKAVYQDKKCIVFSGTMVTTGRARGVVVGTGNNTKPHQSYHCHTSTWPQAVIRGRWTNAPCAMARSPLRRACTGAHAPCANDTHVYACMQMTTMHLVQMTTMHVRMHAHDTPSCVHACKWKPCVCMPASK